MKRATMFCLAAATVVCLAIVGQVESTPHYYNDLLKAEVQSMEFALVMKFLHDKLAHIQARECNDAYKKKGQVLTEDNLKSVMNVFTHQSGNRKTYIYVPESQTGGKGKEYLFNSKGETSGTNHAEDEMVKEVGLPHEFWITNTQCPSCARNLINLYKSSTKPLIHAVHFYSVLPGGPAEQEKSIECLAKMMYNGFKFVLWDWKKFVNDFLKTQKCKDIADDALQVYSDGLEKEEKALADALGKADDLVTKVKEGKMKESELCQP